MLSSGDSIGSLKGWSAIVSRAVTPSMRSAASLDRLATPAGDGASSSSSRMTILTEPDALGGASGDGRSPRPARIPDRRDRVS
jgi:hypothetical protein